MSAHEENGPVGIFGLYGLSYRKCGKEVPAGSTACYERLMASPPRGAVWVLFAIAMRIPSPARFITSDVPPSDTNGKGSPLVGSNPIATAMFTIA